MTRVALNLTLDLTEELPKARPYWALCKLKNDYFNPRIAFIVLTLVPVSKKGLHEGRLSDRILTWPMPMSLEIAANFRATWWSRADSDAQSTYSDSGWRWRRASRIRSTSPANGTVRLEEVVELLMVSCRRAKSTFMFDRQGLLSLTLLRQAIHRHAGLRFDSSKFRP